MTLAVIQSVSGLVTLFAIREQMLSEKEHTPLNTTTNIGYGFTNGLNSLFHRDKIDAVSPVAIDNIIH